MDNRKALEHGQVLSFDGLVCTIERVIGAGSNGIVYEAYYKDQSNGTSLHKVLIKELFPLEPNGKIRRSENGNITYGENEKPFFDLHKKSFDHGNEIHLKLLEKFPDRIGANLNTYSLNCTYYTILGISGGRSLEREIDSIKKEPLGLTAKRFLNILDSLEVFHSEGYLHLDISPDNILVIGNADNERAMLIDFNSVLDVESILTGEGIYYSYKKGYTSPEVKLAQRQQIGFSSDLYSLCAVMYHCIAKKPLDDVQLLMRRLPDLSGCECLDGQPETVKYLLKKILSKGLAVLPEKRYKNVCEMRRDLNLLLDLINGVGVNRWALWEDGRRRVRKTVYDNPSYFYIKDTDNLYPMTVGSEDGEYDSVHRLIEKICSGDADSAFIVGSGGIGKTTALLSGVLSLQSKYSASSSAIIYIPLYNWRDEGGKFIRNRILENLRFKSDTPTFEAARHQLDLILKNPIAQGEKKLPSLLVMLDGYNEAEGDTSALVKEIKELSSFGGVKFLITGRNQVDTFGFDNYFFAPLREADVLSELSKKGLLLPDNKDMVEALKTPLMLSLFISTAESRGQTNVSSKEELIGQYYGSMYEKAIASLPPSSNEKWCIDAAMNLVLPAIAYRAGRKKGALSDKDILAVVKKCCKTVKSPILIKAFPLWLGHTKEILAGAKTPEEWFGKTVHDILWRRLGLLIRDGDSYRIFHQTVGEYLALRYAKLKARLGKYRVIKNTLSIAAVCALTVCGGILFNFIFPSAFENSILVRINAADESVAEDMLDYGITGYIYAGLLCDYTQNAVSYLYENGYKVDKIESTKESLKIFSTDTSEFRKEFAKIKLDYHFKEKTIMPWSYERLDRDNYVKLLDMASENCTAYNEYLDYFSIAWQVSIKYDDFYIYMDYCTAVDALIKADATYAAALYHYVCVPHLEQMDKDGDFYKNALSPVSLITYAESIRKDFPATITAQEVENYAAQAEKCRTELIQIIGKLDAMK